VIASSSSSLLLQAVQAAFVAALRK
jgi:hypothetical protein